MNNRKLSLAEILARKSITRPRNNLAAIIASKKSLKPKAPSDQLAIILAKRQKPC